MDKSKITRFASVTLAFVIMALHSVNLQGQQIVLTHQGKATSIRGLSVINNELAWLSGSNGYVAKTTDGGKTWQWQQIQGFEKSDFRGIMAFTLNEVIVMSSGTPAVILKTTNGGKSWQQKYRNNDKAFFFDAIDFSDPLNGWVLGDPINNKFLLMKTQDGGESWQVRDDLSAPAQTDEAAFAASNSCLRVVGEHLFIVSGGSAANFIHSDDEGKSWQVTPLPIIHGKNSQGAFSLTIKNDKALIVGGDYQHDNEHQQNACFSNDKGQSWQLPDKSPEGYQSAVAYIKDNFFITTGTPGTNVSRDGGKNWLRIDTGSFNVCQKARHGNLVLLAGNDGRIGIFKL